MHPPASIRCSRFAAHHPIFVRCTLTSRLGKRSLIQFPKCHTRVGENPSFFDFSMSDLCSFPPSFFYFGGDTPNLIISNSVLVNQHSDLTTKSKVELINEGTATPLPVKFLRETLNVLIKITSVFPKLKSQQSTLRRSTPDCLHVYQSLLVVDVVNVQVIQRPAGSPPFSVTP